MKLSIIIPAYNAEKYIKECIHSVLNQSYQDYEIIVIDDGSTDQTLDICKHIAENDDRIIIQSQINSGVSVARNKGIDAAKGDWITFIDADDMLQTGALNILHNNVFNVADIVVTGNSSKLKSEQEFDVAANKVSKQLLTDGVFRFYKYKKQISKVAPIDWYNNFTSWGRYFRRELLQDNDIKFPLGVKLSEDKIFCIKAYNAAKNIYSLNIITYFYRYTAINSATKVNKSYFYTNGIKLIEEARKLYFLDNCISYINYRYFIVSIVLSIIDNIEDLGYNYETKLNLLNKILDIDNVRDCFKSINRFTLMQGHKKILRTIRLIGLIKKNRIKQIFKL